jgi:phage terminase Nu1 subunit (DNA packaging protein)
LLEKRVAHWTKSSFMRDSGLTRAQVDRLIALGMPCETIGQGRGAEVRLSRSGTLRWLSTLALSAAEGGELGDDVPAIVRARVRLYLAQAEGVEQKNAVARGQLLPADEVVAGWQAAIGRSRALLLGMPVTVAPQLVLLARQHAEDPQALERAAREAMIRSIDAALTELASTALDEFEDDDAPEAGGDGDAA